MFFYFISSADLISILFYYILFYSIQFYFISNRFDSIWFDLILFYSILLNSIYYIVQYSISYQWMICVHPFVFLSVCLSVWVSLCFLFSPVSLFFLFSFHIHFSFFTLFSHERLPHTHTRTRTHKYIHMNICSFLWLVHITSKGGKWRIVFEW